MRFDDALVTRRELLVSSGKLIVGSSMLPLFAGLAGCGGSGVGGVVLNNPATRSLSAQWTATMLDAITAVRPGPPMTARAIGMVATAAFDAWAAYDAVAVGTRFGKRLRRPEAEHTLDNKNKAVSFAAYRVLVDLYPAEKARFDAKMAELGYNPADTSMDTTTAVGIGNAVANELLLFRHADGSNQLNAYADTTGYVPVNTPDSVVDPSKWQQLRFANGKSPAYIAPHWGNVIPFALSSPAAIRPAAPPFYGSPTYLDQMQEVIDITARLDDRGKIIAEYWADGPGSVLPPGHWQLFGLWVSQRDKHDLDKDIKMFFMLGNAVFDAGIACWDCKRFFNTSRPFTAIRANYAGKQVTSFGGPGVGMVTADGSQWFPYQSPNFITPPFAEYTSGHSTFSAASAEVLQRFTGSDNFGNSVTLPANWSVFDPAVPSAPVTLSWPTFSDAATEAGMSRLYGGIHFRAANYEGQKCGREVGRQVYQVCMEYITGAAASRIP